MNLEEDPMTYTKEQWDEIRRRPLSDGRLQAFLESPDDGYTILQLRWSSDTSYERFASMRELKRMGREPKLSSYEVAYTAPLPEYSSRDGLLESLYTKFNICHPADYQGQSMSVSDIVALKENGVVSCHYVDSIGFKELPDFLQTERPSVLEQLKSMPVSEAAEKTRRKEELEI